MIRKIIKMSNEYIPVISREALQDKVFVLAGTSFQSPRKYIIRLTQNQGVRLASELPFLRSLDRMAHTSL